MIHYWECHRCTHEWESSCMGEMLTKPEDRQRHDRQLWSGLCWDCFELLEANKLDGLAIYNLVCYLRVKEDNYGASKPFETVRYNGLWHEHKYSGLCHDIHDPRSKDGKHYEFGWTAEHKQLQKISYELDGIYDKIIEAQRTSKRIELDELRDARRKQGLGVHRFFGPSWRPEGFVGDEPGQDRFEVLGGIDFAKGEIVPPTIKMNDGTSGE